MSAFRIGLLTLVSMGVLGLSRVQAEHLEAGKNQLSSFSQAIAHHVTATLAHYQDA